jgi:hypothetical protein
VVAHFNKFAVCAWQEAPDDNQVELSPPGDLRPFRTPEQIAADERTHSILNACSAINSKVEQYNVSIDCSAAMRAVIEAMIDAGYHK